MKKIMIRTVVGIVAVAVIVLACSKLPIYGTNKTGITPQFDANGYWKTPAFVVKQNDNDSFAVYGNSSAYGAYLAGRVAHLRQDFKEAAEYYKIVLDKDSNNAYINRSVYIILSSLGEIDQAEPYARREIENTNKESLAPLILAVKDFHDAKYDNVRKDMQPMQEQLHKHLVNPLFEAWSYAGERQEEKAIAALDKIMPDPSIKTMTLFHKALIYDYLGNTKAASEIYTDILRNHKEDVTYRILEVMTDFYVRHGQKDTARNITQHYNDNSMLSLLLSDINKKIDNGTPQTPAIVNTPQKGMAEGLFNVGTLFRVSTGGSEFAQIYLAAASYLNPEYEVAKLSLANVLEEQGLLNEANKYYEQISKNSGSYFIARMKIIENLNAMEKYAEAKKYLLQLLKDNPDNTQLLSDLGNLNNNLKNNEEAIKNYQDALKSMRQINSESWPIYYALAVSYDSLNQKDKAEESLLKALELSNRHPNVLNYLGYTWLVRNKNIDEAIKMIIEAYQQYPYEGHIIDSMGWVYFRLGNYKKAIEYLEQASDMNPGNAVISDHLGDAYWFGGRKNEAQFQWKHALVLKEDADSVDKKAIKAKIADGKSENEVVKIADPQVQKLLDELANIE